MSDVDGLKSLGGETNYEYSDPSKEQLETFKYMGRIGIELVGFKTDEFTSLCPRTGQPDFASIDIAYLPRELGVESKSLKLYLFRYRNHGAFHEDCVGKITSDLVDVLDPKYLRVIGDFTRRGGIAIKPLCEYVAEDSERPDALLEQYDRYKFER